MHEELTRLTANKGTGLSFGFVFSLLFALWSAMAGVKAIIDALNVAYGEKEKRSFIRLNLVALVFTLGAIVSMIVALGAVVVLPIVLGHFGLEGVTSTLIGILEMADPACACNHRSRGSLPLCAEPHQAALALG